MSICNNLNECLSSCSHDLNTLHEFLSLDNFVFCPCNKYFTPEEFNVYFESKSKPTNAFSCIHMNSRSLLNNFDNIIEFLSSVKLHPTVLCVTETWFQEHAVHPLCNIDGYKFEGISRLTRRGGGVGVFINKNVQYIRRLDLEQNDSCIESVFVEIYNNNNPGIIVGSIYRPPDQSVDIFLDRLLSVFSIVNREKKIMYFVGDYNINLLNVGKVQYVDNFLNLLLSHHMYPLIDQPTRITDDTASLIDNIITNDVDSVESGIFITDISDHLPVYCISQSDIQSHQTLNQPSRTISDKTINCFLRSLQLVHWSCHNNNPNVNYVQFLDKFLHLYNLCFPLKCLKKTPKKNKPWINYEIRQLSKKKCRLYRLYLRNPTPYRKEVYRKCRNKVSNMIKRAKKTLLYGKFYNS